MTAVAAGAALYASTRKIPSEFQNRDLAKIQLDLNYEATTVILVIKDMIVKINICFKINFNKLNYIFISKHEQNIFSQFSI